MSRAIDFMIVIGGALVIAWVIDGAVARVKRGRD